MRVSVIRGDAGYRASYGGACITAKVNGVKIQRCHTADTDLGEAICHDEPLRVNFAGNRIEEVVLRGDVTIEFPEMI